MGTASQHFNGEIDSPYLFSSPLTDDQSDWMADNQPSYTVLGSSTDANNPGQGNVVLAPRLDETSGTRRDASASEAHLADNGSTSYAAGYVAEYAGMEDRALEFNGSNQDASRNAGLVSAFPASLSLWFKTADKSATVTIAGCFLDNSNFLSIQERATGIPRAVLAAGGSSFADTWTADVADGAWHHAVAVFTSSQVEFYVDGVSTGSPTAHASSFPAVDTFNIASRLSTDLYFNGSVDEVMVFNVELDATDVSELYKNGIGLLVSDFSGSSPLTSGESPIAGYSLNTLDANGANDDGIGSADLTLNNSPTNTAGIPAGQVSGKVHTLKDQSSAGNDIIQATIGKRPEYIDSAVNSLPALLGDGSDDFLQVTYAGGAVSEPHDTWIVFALIDTGAGTIIDGINDSNESGFRIDATPNYEIDAGTAQAAGAPNTSWHIALITWGATDKLYIDGGAAVISANAGTETKTGRTLFGDVTGANNKDCYIAEIIDTNSASSTADRNIIGTQLASIYGTTWNTIS